MIGAYIIAFVLYFFVLLGFGFYFYHRNKTAADFILGSRSLNYWVTAIAAQASDMSDYLFMAVPGALFAFGVFECWMPIGLVTGMFLNWQFIAPALRIQTEKYKALTLSTYFENRFTDTSGIIRTVSGIISLIFFVFYISSALVGLGRLFESVFHISYHTGIVTSLGIAMLYTLIGGFVAVAWSDLFQGLFLLVMITLVPAVAFGYIDGIQAIISTAQAHHIPLSLFPDYSWNTIKNILLLTFGWGLGYFGQPHILINFMGIKDVTKMKKAQYVGITWQIIVLTAASLVGLIAIPFFNANIVNRELVFVNMTTMLFPPLLAGFILCAILAATMSTINTQMLVSASILSQDFYEKTINPHATQRQLLFISRFCIIIVPIIASIIAFNNSNTVLDLVNYAWSGLGSSFSPLVISALYFNWPNKYGALAGILTGAIVAGSWPYFNSSVLPLIPGFITSFIALYLVSIITRKKK